MAYNYGPPPGGYGQPPQGYGAPPGGVPGMGGPPPGVMPSQSPAGMAGQFQPPPNMPNFDMNAKVIRMGVPNAGPPQNRGQGDGRGGNSDYMGGGRQRAGLGVERGGGDRNLDRERAAVRENMMALQPPTREEVARTIFIGGLGESTPDDIAVEEILRSAGKLRRWTRAKDADGKKCKFGFAEYEDVESLEAANEIFQDIQVPQMKNGAVLRDDDGEVKKVPLLVVVDEQSKNYIEDWKARRKEDEEARQFRLDGCREDLRQCIANLINVGASYANGALADFDGDVQMGDGMIGEQNGGEAEIVSVAVNMEDELADIPADMRATVAAEIKAFRDRSNRRDVERLRQEEEAEQAERQRGGLSRINRLASPGASGSATNGIPLGPRGVQGAPSGPKGYRGAQLPSDYVNGVAFVGERGNGLVQGESSGEEDEDDEALEQKRKEETDRDKEKVYIEIERQVRNRERHRHSAKERQRNREEDDERTKDRIKERAAQDLLEWDDKREADIRRHEYYKDRSLWARKRAAVRDREAYEDERDRVAEEREKADESRYSTAAQGMADTFLAQAANEMAHSNPRKPVDGFGGFKLSLGTAATKTRGAADSGSARPKIAPEIEGLLQDEEDAAEIGQARPRLKPLTDLSTVPVRGADLTPEERAEARKALVSEIPIETEQLFARSVQWGYLTEEVLSGEIRPFVEKKVVEYLGVQEDMLVDMVMDGIKKRKEAKDLVEDLGVALEEESEQLVKKVWRLLVYFSEAEARGLYP